MMPQVDVQKLAAALALGAVLTAAGGGWLHHRLVAQRQDRLTQLAAECVRLKQLGDTAEPLAAEVAVLDAGLQDLQATVPAAPDMGGLIEQLAASIARPEVTDQRITTAAMLEGARFSRIPVTLQCRASFETLFGMLRHAETSSRMLRVDSLRASRDPVASDARLTVVMELSAYTRTEQGGKP